MIIECLFIVRRPTVARTCELVVAWDEYAIDENREGWESECNDALRAIGAELQSSRYVSIDISTQELFKALDSVKIKGTLDV